MREAENEGWYNHKGFFEHKLAKPEIYDKGMIKTEAEELQMPTSLSRSAQDHRHAGLTPEAAGDSALTTFLMGAVDSQIPQRYWDVRKTSGSDIQEGWWVVKKYNCMGCHQFMVGQSSRLMTLPRYQTPEWKDQLPPKLMGEGARANPEWMLKFLANPAMDAKDTDRNGVRPYLKVRMPTFYFSPIEIRKLVRFFQALAGQPMPYIPPKLEPLSDQEIAMARALFTSKAAPCLKCHATGDATHDKFATAPNFLLARDRLKPGWARRWMLDPAMISPGTAMPSGLFKQRWLTTTFSPAPRPPIFKGYDGDQPELLVRYMFEITPEEQHRLMGMSAGMMKQTTENQSEAQSRRRIAGRDAGERALAAQARAEAGFGRACG